MKRTLDAFARGWNAPRYDDRRHALRMLVAIASLLGVWTAGDVRAESATFPGESLYQLRPALTDQTGATLSLDRFAGKPVIVSMFYASCPNICPALVETIQATGRELAKSGRELPHVLLVTFDDAHDTPATLAAIADKRHLDASGFTLARARASDVRVLAAALGIQYRRLPDGSFNHATVITLLDARGVPVARTSKLGEPDPVLLDGLRRLQ